MDPISAIGLVGSVVGIVDIITKSVAYLSSLQSTYKIADLKVRLLIGQLSTLKAALDQVANLINSRPDIPRDDKLVHDLSVALTCVEAVIFAVDDRLSDIQRNDDRGLKTLSKVAFVWDEQTINDYMTLLNNQVNALNLLLTALQCRTIVERTEVVEGLECQDLLRLVRDDTSSLLWLRDSQSIGTYRSTGPQDFGTINTNFDFDTEIFASKVYRTATRSSMLRTLLLDAGPEDQQDSMGLTLDPSTRQLESGLPIVNEPTTGELSVSSSPALEEPTTSGNRDGILNNKLQRLPSPTALPNYTIYTLEALQSLPLVHAPLEISPLPSASQQRVRKRRALLTRSWLARPSSPNLSAIVASRMAQPTVKVLVLGISESGKSTLIKSFKEGYIGGYDEETRTLYRSHILRNLLECTQAIVHAAVVYDIEGETAFAAACDLIKGAFAFEIFGRAGTTGSEVSEVSLPTDISSAIQTLWNEAPFHQVLEKAIFQSSFYVIDAASYFGKSVNRILDPNYVPTVEDILYSRRKTTGIYETRFVHDGADYQFFDHGGVRIERKKWIHTFENVNAIVFTCDVSCYDTVLLEDSTQNRMLEQIILFDSLVNSKWFVNSYIVVVFTKEDKLTARKLLASPFQAVFPDYTGHPESVEDIINYLVFRFRDRAPSGPHPNVVFCRSISIASSTTGMGEVIINALQKRSSL